MSEEKWDAIVVGAGVAGSTAAFVLARGGARVLLVERGEKAGSKNMSGGRVYASGLKRIFPKFSALHAVERRVVQEKMSFLTDNRMVTAEFRTAKPDDVNASYTVLRATLDRWLATEAENAGAEVVSGARVDDVVMSGDKAVGVAICGETLRADVVILADGVNSLLGERLGMTQKLTPHTTALGVKTVIELPESVINERFALKSTEACAWLFAGAPTAGLMGGGFLYTNKTSLSLGVVCHLDQIHETGKTAPELLDTFYHHPLIAPLIKDGKIGEYSAHLVHESGAGGVAQKCFGNGVLVIGDAAGLCLNLGYTVRGMDLAVASGEIAAKTVLTAKARGDFSKSTLAQYRASLIESFVGKDLMLYHKTPKVLRTPRFFNAYPELAADVLEDMFTVNEKGAEPLLKKCLRRCEKIRMATMVKDFVRAVRSL